MSGNQYVLSKDPRDNSAYQYSNNPNLGPEIGFTMPSRSSNDSQPIPPPYSEAVNSYPSYPAYGGGLPSETTPTPQAAFPNTNSNNMSRNEQWGNLGSGLNNKAIRIAFIRKVYLILSAQLIFTFGVCSIFVFVTPVKQFVTTTNAGIALYIVSYIIFVILIIVAACCDSVTRKVPFNYILLFLITLSMTYMLSMVSAYHQVSSVLIAVGITLFVTFGVTLFSLQTKFDFTKNCLLIPLCLSLALLGLGIAILITFRYNPVLNAVYGGLGACLMAIYLAIDTQMLFGHKKYKFSEEDYINAALQLYLDISVMFLYILQAFGKK